MLATGYGACHGLVAVARAFKHFARFTCSGRKADSIFARETFNDVMLAQKIALETNERGALAVAHRSFVSM